MSLTDFNSIRNTKVDAKTLLENINHNDENIEDVTNYGGPGVSLYFEVQQRLMKAFLLLSLIALIP
jgi:hypothetical protein